jgi:amidophosphoribosyltransferase
LHEECGVFGVFSHSEDVARISFFALFALQHRGQESAGIATTDGNSLKVYARMGLVSQVFSEDSLAQLKGGYIAIGHNRYSTTGSSRICNAQPIVLGDESRIMAIAHNGNIVNSENISRELTQQGCQFASTTDSEVIGQLMVRNSEKNWVDRIRYAMHRIKGAYSLTILTKDTLYAVRDPFGVRPLCLGTLDHGWAVASETCAFDHIGATFVREIEPGEIVAINEDGVKS